MSRWMAVACCGLMLGAGGCAANKDKESLIAAYTALNQRQYDVAVGDADQYLQAHPTGAGTAEAWYVRGRAIEQRGPKASADASERDLQEARENYVKALGAGPAPSLEGRIRASVGNVAYYQNDYRTAAAQYGAAFDKLDNADDKAWALYRTGVSQQRLGQFGEADRTFTAVEQQFPNTEQALRARNHQGKQAFYVQLATFSSVQPADAAVQALTKQGVAAQRVADPSGRGLQVVRVGPFPTFDEAHALQRRMASLYPGALILP